MTAAPTPDLAAELVQAILANRDQINASALAADASGCVELHVNRRVQAVEVKILVANRGTPYRLGPRRIDAAY